MLFMRGTRFRLRSFVGEGQIAQQLDPKQDLVLLEMSIKSSALTADGSFSQHTFIVRRD
jgi:hypothetical protein